MTTQEKAKEFQKIRNYFLQTDVIRSDDDLRLYVDCLYELVILSDALGPKFSLFYSNLYGELKQAKDMFDARGLKL